MDLSRKVIECGFQKSPSYDDLLQSDKILKCCDDETKADLDSSGDSLSAELRTEIEVVRHDDCISIEQSFKDCISSDHRREAEQYFQRRYNYLRIRLHRRQLK
ncbi:hypothetical protein RF11_07444 [Thelohanellus kitauei]|uniref:Uncharacterized protein n=1 Tax=Thelohanellus kitauei TaxID=669202 RepID=A0A0C2J4V6_THEKT|nr:hypothetical protein RF11_07444 [Thelohanellus kitauei]